MRLRYYTAEIEYQVNVGNLLEKFLLVAFLLAHLSAMWGKVADTPKSSFGLLGLGNSSPTLISSQDFSMNKFHVGLGIRFVPVPDSQVVTDTDLTLIGHTVGSAKKPLRPVFTERDLLRRVVRGLLFTPEHRINRNCTEIERTRGLREPM